jgi:hypothetical protein
MADYIDKIGLNEYQNATAWTAYNAAIQAMLWAATNGRDGSALEADSTVLQLVQEAQLPPNQWEIELSGWFSATLAVLQQQIVEAATEPLNSSNESVITGPSDEFELAICKRQMIRNASGYQNFSILGVAIILSMGSFIIILGTTIDSIWGLAQKVFQRKHYTSYGLLAWETDGFLQLQIMAQEAAGHNEWVNCDSHIPVLRNLEKD